MEFRQKNYADARRQFENFITVFPDHNLAPDAREKAAEAAFKHCRNSYENGDFTAARECLVDFKQDYPDHDQVSDADEYIEKIDRQMPDSTGQQEHAET